jgi:hypothetical protein
MSKSEFSRKIGVSPSFVTRYIKLGIIKEHNGKIDFEEATCALIKETAHGKKKGETRIKLPDSTVSIDTIVAVETFSEEKGVSFGKALELMLLESNTFNTKLDVDVSG